MSRKSLSFQKYPGAHERRLQRHAGNPLFAASLRDITQTQISQAQHQDAKELQQFLEAFQGLIQEAVALEPTVESDVILDLKERLDRSYEQVSSLVGDQAEAKTAITKLISVVMAVVRRNAQDDPHALQKLAEEDSARATHFSLQNHTLVADLMREDGIINREELVPSLLHDSHEGLMAALPLFDPEHLALLAVEARVLLETCEPQRGALPEAHARMQEIEKAASAPPEALLN